MSKRTAVVLGLAVGASSLAAGLADSFAGSASDANESTLAYRKIVQKEVSEHLQWRRVSIPPAWAPTLCNPPELPVQQSQSSDSLTHGQKLYFLYAKYENDYQMLGDDLSIETPDGFHSSQQNRVGQIIVKESWHPVKASEREAKLLNDGNDDVQIDSSQFVKKDGTWYRAGEKGPLFAVMKVSKTDDPGTDNGWIYTTLTPDGKEITGIGRMESCMECHRQAPHERLFGIHGK